MSSDNCNFSTVSAVVPDRFDSTLALARLLLRFHASEFLKTARNNGVNHCGPFVEHEMRPSEFLLQLIQQICLAGAWNSVKADNYCPVIGS